MYSQNKEEQYILEYFGDRVGTFLSLGENDGQTFSNVRALALKGWKGVMVEPSPKAFERLKTLYNGHKGFYLYPFAVSAHNGKAMLQDSGPLCTANDIGLVSTFHSCEVARFSRTVKYEPVEVKTFKWKTFLNRLKSIKMQEFTMISMDIEGDEPFVLPDMDLSKTDLICIEHNGNKSRKDKFLEHTSKFGISKIIYESGENLIIVR